MGWGTQKRFAHTGVFYVFNTPWIFRGGEPIWRNGLQCDYPPSGERPVHPWSEGSGENINSTPEPIPEEKNTNVRVIFIDKQFETPLSSRSNSPHSESSFTTLFLSPKGELHSPPSSSSSALCLFHSGSLPVSGSWMGPTSGPLTSPATGLENPLSFSHPLYPIQFPLQSLSLPPGKFQQD